MAGGGGGGGGGGGWGGWSRGGGGTGGGGDAPAVDKAVSDVTATSSYDAQANAYLQALLSDYNDRDTETIRQRIETLQSAVEKDIDGEIDTLFGGSVRKHTYVDGLSDIDVLMTVNASELADASPEEVLAYFERRLADRLRPLGVQVKAGTLAVTVSYADGIEIQVLPALKTATGIRIASPEGGWSSVVRPQSFAQKLTTVNQANGGRVVPVIKLFKGLQTQLPSNSQVKGYHIESLAIEAFRSYQGRQTHKDMLRHFIEFASNRVLRPIADTTGQSLHVDDYLSAAGSAARTRVSGALGRLGAKLSAAEKRNSVDALIDVFQE